MKRRFRKKKISIWVSQIEAKARGPLAYHRRWKGTTILDEWVITHIPTGLTFGPKHYESEEQAREYLLLIEGFCKAKKIKLDVDEASLKEHFDTFKTFITEVDKLDEGKRKALLTKLTGET